MLPSMLSRLFYGEEKQDEGEKTKEEEETLKRSSIREENGDWLLISYESSVGNTNSRVNSECDLDSECSDSSWVITPAPAFRQSQNQPSGTSALTANPMEDLLIEHPTMSVYRQNSLQNGDEDENMEDEEEGERDADGAAQANSGEAVDEIWNRNRELVMQRNRHRQELAAHLQIPLARNALNGSPPKEAKKHPRVSRKAMKRHNTASSGRTTVRRQALKCGFKAGRRRC